MKLRAYRVESSPKLMIIPMIDIIFFLLVFFMMSTLHMVYQKTIPVNLPLAATVQQDVAKPLTISISHSGTLHWEQEEIAPEALRGRLRQIMASQPQQAVVLRADQSVEHGKVIAVMDELKLGGVQKLAIAAQHKQR